MKVWGLLCWYEEPESWLVSTVCSLRDLCDGIIAVDGAYASFPGGLRTPRSDPSQAEAIFRAAYSSGMICNIHTPSEPWWSTDTPDEEVAKRDFMFRLGDTLGEPGDWYFVIDADEVVHHVPFDVRQRLEKAEEEIAEVELWMRPNERFLSPRLYRGPGVRIVGHHYQWVKDGKKLGWPRRGPDAEPALLMSDLVIEHRVQHRDDYRKHQKDTYYKLRDRMIEAAGMMPLVSDGQPRIPDLGGIQVTHGGAALTASLEVDAMPSKEDIIAALLRELVAYKTSENEKGVAEVEAELAAYGWKPTAAAKRAETRPAEFVEKRGPGRPKKVAE